MEDTPPSTPPDAFIEPELQAASRRDGMLESASTKSEQEANMEVESLLQGALPPGGASPALVDNSDDSQSQSKFTAAADESNQSTSQKRKHDDVTAQPPPQQKKRKRKGSGKGGTGKLDKSTSAYM